MPEGTYKPLPNQGFHILEAELPPLIHLVGLLDQVPRVDISIESQPYVPPQ